MKLNLRKPSRASLDAIAAVVLVGVLAGCNFAPRYSRPAMSLPPEFKGLTTNTAKQVDGWKVAEPNDNAIRGEWWKIFGDGPLDALEVEAGTSNQTVAAAFANFLAARAVVKQSRSQLFPTISTSPSVTRAKQVARQTGFTTSGNSITFSEFSLPLDASWEPDLWGNIRNTLRANSLQAQATFADLQNARLTVQAELAADYFQLRILDGQKQLFDAAVVAYRASLELTQVRHQTGIASDQDVAQAETQLNTTAAQDTDLGIERSQLEHAIAMLLGKTASTFSIPPTPPAAKPIAVPLGIPSQLLERRPDIAAAERRVAAANAQIGVARAAYFPTLTLTGSGGYQSTSVGSLISGPNLAWSIGATLAQTIFDAGRRKAVTEQAWANYQAVIADYRQTVLTAFQQVEDNLSSLRILTKELQEQDAAVASSQRYLALANDRYRLGIDSYLNVITAETTLLSNQRTAMNLRSEQLTATVQLIKALGGGWDGNKSVNQ